MRALRTFLLAIVASGTAAAADEAGRYEKLAQSDCSVWIKGEDRRYTSWSGACREGKVEGSGILRGEWRDDKGQWRPIVYEGDMRAGKQHGYGHNMREGGGEYRGQYRDGEAEGWGHAAWPSGETYEGQWHKSRFHGIGTLKGGNAVTKGRFVEGKLVGARERSGDKGAW